MDKKAVEKILETLVTRINEISTEVEDLRGLVASSVPGLIKCVEENNRLRAQDPAMILQMFPDGPVRSIKLVRDHLGQVLGGVVTERPASSFGN